MKRFYLPAHPLRHPFDFLGAYPNARQFVEIFLPESERTVGADLAHHPAHPGTVGCPLDIEGLVFGTIPSPAFAVRIVGPLDDHGAQYRQQILVPILDKFLLMTLTTGNGSPAVISPIRIDECFQHSAPNRVQGRTDAHFKRFQIHPPGGVLLRSTPAYDPADFLLYFFINCFRNFFLSAASSWSSFISGTGRRSQIRSLVSTSSSQSFTKR